jgi:hypothetical protein
MGVKSILTQGGDGTAIPEGMVGQRKYASQSIGSLGSNPTGHGASLTLTPGVWSVSIAGGFRTVAPTFYAISLADNAGTALSSDTDGYPITANWQDLQNTGNAASLSHSGMVIRITTSTTYTVRYIAGAGSGGATDLFLSAIRIAGG